MKRDSLRGEFRLNSSCQNLHPIPLLERASHTRTPKSQNFMGGKASSSRKKSSKMKRKKISSKKKSRKKESKVLHGPDSVSLSSKSKWSTSSESDYRTRKNKSKKRRRDDSASSDSDDHSLTSASESLSTHDNKSYKRRKALPQGRKRRTRKRFESAESDAESRRKRCWRHHVVKSSNKPLKKKSGRHFVSSSSSDSESCSTCDSRSSNSTGDGKHRRSKMILHKKIKSSRARESHRARRKRNARNPSGSSCGTCRHHDVIVDQTDEALDHDISVDRNGEALVPVNNSRRLKSVITIVNRPTDEEENRWEKDPPKEEIVCDHDDYPSPKSMDSNEGVNKKESDDQSHGASNKRSVENVESEVILHMKSGNEGYNASRSREVHTNRSENEKKINVSVNFASFDGDKKKDDVADDIELILRQKALANLRKFKGGLQAAQKSVDLDTNNENVNESPIKRNNNIEDKSTAPNSFLAQETNKRSRPTLPEVKQVSDSEHTITDPPEAPVVLAGNDTNKAAGEHSSKEQLDEAKNECEFEKKTMAVMRGGEMVQVSYKVYIPKRAPALAQRQLRR